MGTVSFVSEYTVYVNECYSPVFSFSLQLSTSGCCIKFDSRIMIIFNYLKYHPRVLLIEKEDSSDCLNMQLSAKCKRFQYNTEFFFLPKQSQDMDPSYKMDLGFRDCLKQVKLVLQQNDKTDLVVCSHSRERGGGGGGGGGGGAGKPIL